ncbi:protein NATD1 isoform X1 [Pristis pectinata]|uniref:protein NATD1 isoform X1 n=1 Tax=Pristis pectinata TaxID=685728 RepID=UPI00223CD47C|nr:protein NATD1 isoform X1 [Pristis pectinata]
MAEPSSIPIQDENNCPIKVVHDRKRRQFQVRLNDSHERAVLLYEYVGKKTIDLQHTEVPDAYRGRGIAKLMAKVHTTRLVVFPVHQHRHFTLLKVPRAVIVVNSPFPIHWIQSIGMRNVFSQRLIGMKNSLPQGLVDHHLRGGWI